MSLTLEEGQRRLAKVKRSGRPSERLLTDIMCASLTADATAAHQAANALLARTSPDRRTRVLEAHSMTDQTEVRGEQPYSVRISRVRRAHRERRYDLLFIDRPDRALAVEVKLGASLAHRQLDDLLRVPAEALELPPQCRIGVLVLGPRQLDLSQVKDPHGRFLGSIRWQAVLGDLVQTPFAHEDWSTLWADCLGWYLRRGAFGAQSVRRPPPSAALDALAVSLRDHVQQRLMAEGWRVRLDAGRSHRAIEGRVRTANLELVIERPRSPRRQQRITIWLKAPKGGRRVATVVAPDESQTSFRAPAALDALEQLLKARLDRLELR